MEKWYFSMLFHYCHLKSERFSEGFSERFTQPLTLQVSCVYATFRAFE